MSTVLKESLQSDPLHPILVEAHYVAIDRRLQQILQTVRQCIHQRKVSQSGEKTFDEVIVDDSF